MTTTSKAVKAGVARKTTTKNVMATTNKPEVITSNLPAETAKPEVITAVTAASKASIANAIFGDCYKQEKVPARKDIIARAVKEAGLTPKGAATYLQNYRTKHNMVTKKVVAVAATA